MQTLDLADRKALASAAEDRPMTRAEQCNGMPPKSKLGAVWSGFVYYWLTGNIVLMGSLLGIGYIPETPTGAHKFNFHGEWYANWDGQWYKNISEQGYFYNPRDYSSVAFFPAFPMAGRILARSLGIDHALALLIVANMCHIFAFMMMALYIDSRYPDSPATLRGYVLAAMGLLPTTFFCRMAYSESMFVMLLILALFGMWRRWPLAVIALVIGLATATRPVGVGLIPAFLLHIRHRSPTAGGFVARAAMMVPIACWGLLVYMAFQYAAFGNPLAFAQTQENWAARFPRSLMEKVIALTTLEPFRAIYDVSGPGYWGRRTGKLDFPFSLRAADPCFLLGSLGLAALGYRKRWLTSYEAITVVCLMGIPYWTHGYEQYLTSQGRFAASAAPIFIVLGQLAIRAPAPLVAVIAGGLGLLLGAEAALFLRWHTII